MNGCVECKHQHLSSPDALVVLLKGFSSFFRTPENNNQSLTAITHCASSDCVSLFIDTLSTLQKKMGVYNMERDNDLFLLPHHTHTCP